MEQLLERLAADPIVTNAIIGVIALGLLDWILGILRAIRDSTFQLKYLDVWVRTQLLGRIVPIILILLFGQVVGAIQIGDVELNLLVIGGLGAAAAFAVSTLQSILDNVRQDTLHDAPRE